jgi:hypothetical protein
MSGAIRTRDDARAVIRHLIILVALGLTIACKTGPPGLSLEEVREITARSSATFVPPPRTISDVKALLEPVSYAAVDRLQMARRRADGVAVSMV